MKITLKTSNLKNLLSYHKKVSVASLNKHSSLSSIYFYYDKSNPNFLSIMSSDGENVLRTDLAVKTENAVNFIDFRLTAEKLNNIVSTLKDEDLTLEIVLPQVKLICGNRNVEITCLSGDFFFTKDFFVPTTNLTELNFQEFKENFELTVFPSNQTSVNKIYSCVLFSLNSKKLKMVCTDGYLLSEQSFDVDNTITEELVVPVEAASVFVNTIQSIVDVYKKSKIALNAKFSISFDEKYLLLNFTSDDFVVLGRITLVDMSYPLYAALVPKVLKSQILVNVKALREIVSSITSSSEHIELDIENSIVLHKNNEFSNKSLLFFAKDKEAGIVINDRLTVQHFGEDSHIIFSSKYLDKILGNIEKVSEWVIMGYNQFPGAILLLPSEENCAIIDNVKNNRIFIIMPLNSGDTQYQAKSSAKKVNNG